MSTIFLKILDIITESKNHYANLLDLATCMKLNLGMKSYSSHKCVLINTTNIPIF